MQLKEFPGPKGHLIWGNLKERNTDAVGFFTQCMKEYGDTFKVRFGPQNIIVTGNADYIKYVLQENPHTFVRRIVYNKLSTLLGKGLLTTDGPEWKQQRKLMQPAFHQQSIQLLFELMFKNTETMVKEWQNHANKKTVCDISDDFMKLTLRIVSQALFGFDSRSQEDQISKDVTWVLPKIMDYLTSFLPKRELWPFLSNFQYWKKINNLNKVIFSIIENRRKNLLENAETAPSRDLLSMLMNAKDEVTGKGMNDRQLRDEVMTMFMAGHETTANALNWCVYFISQNPEIESRLRKEIKNVVGDSCLTMAHIKSLSYTKMVFEESLRLRPPVWSIPRTVSVDTEIDGYNLKKGYAISNQVLLLHRNPKYWSDPEKFDPERFSEENKKTIPKNAFLPFGTGPHTCIGNQFAYLEAQIILVSIYQKFSLKPEFHHEEIRQDAKITLRPLPNLKMKIEFADLKN